MGKILPSWKLTFIIGYSNQHYIAFVRNQQSWYVCDDIESELIGKLDELLLFLTFKQFIKWK